MQRVAEAVWEYSDKPTKMESYEKRLQQFVENERIDVEQCWGQFLAQVLPHWKGKDVTLERVQEGCSNGATPLGIFPGRFRGVRQSPEHQTNHCQTHHTFAAACQVLIILTHTARASHPRKRSFYYPALGQDPSKFLGFWFDALIGEPDGAHV
ncbi:hypothetical protein KDAU_07830 [Dictyobacter aurantiacus]|uniref:Uncharacterized protein n=1 Tax=Dictyobacter aurantiacus TaxID=1936993 RepID=A0A401Z9B1_9CHLR|nr:hypothetical protein KDAU_07830 [Dictyobacter aurantiacus]